LALVTGKLAPAAAIEAKSARRVIRMLDMMFLPIDRTVFALALGSP
jgi:hypothetical protein